MKRIMTALSLLALLLGASVGYAVSVEMSCNNGYYEQCSIGGKAEMGFCHKRQGSNDNAHLNYDKCSKGQGWDYTCKNQAEGFHKPGKSLIVYCNGNSWIVSGNTIICSPQFTKEHGPGGC